MPAGTSPGSNGPIRSPDKAALSNLMLCPKAVNSEGSPFNLSRAAISCIDDARNRSGVDEQVQTAQSRDRSFRDDQVLFHEVERHVGRLQFSVQGHERAERDGGSDRGTGVLWRMAPPRLRTVRSRVERGRRGSPVGTPRSGWNFAEVTEKVREEPTGGSPNSRDWASLPTRRRTDWPRAKSHGSSRS